MKHSMTFLIAAIVIFFFSTTAFAGWLIFHKPAFRGKVIDAETKAPIEGAVVVVIYNTHTIMGGPAGGWSTIIKVKETLTDKSGEFSFPAYTTVMNPNATDFYTDFIIYKPGYGSFPGFQACPPPPYVGHETHFSEKRGKRIEFQKNSKTISFIAGIIELPKVKTWEERRKANPSAISDIPTSEWPILNEMTEKEDEWLKHNKGWRR